MTRLRQPSALGFAPARQLNGGRVLVTGPTGRAIVLTPTDLVDDHSLQGKLSPLGIYPQTADVEALAGDEIETGELNWEGPATHVILCSSHGRTMTPTTAKTVVDFIFTTPAPALTVELVDEDSSGWPAAWFAVSYARRRAEWSRRAINLNIRAKRPPPSERQEFLRGHGVDWRADLDADQAGMARLFSAKRARIVVGPAADAPRDWIDRLSAAGIESVEWVPSASSAASVPAACRYGAFVAAALDRLIDIHETTDLRDELATGLLSGRPWDVPGTDLLATLAYAPDGSIFTSEEGWKLAAERGDETLRIGPVATLRFKEFPAIALVRALTTALAREAQPLCAACVYRPYCLIPPSAHVRAQGTLYGRLPDSPRCVAHMAILDSIFSRLNDEKCLGALSKWSVDIKRFNC